MKKPSKGMRGILTDWEREILRTKKLNRYDRQYRYRVEKRISNTLDVLDSDIREILFSERLTTFNLSKKGKWKQLQFQLELGLKDLERRTPKLSYSDIKSVSRGGQDCFYSSGTHRFEYNEGGLLVPVRGVKATMVGFMPMESREDSDMIKKFIHQPDKLKLWLSIRNIKKRHQRSIVKKALISGYRFPDSLDLAVPISELKYMINEIERGGKIINITSEQDEKQQKELQEKWKKWEVERAQRHAAAGQW